MASRKTFVRHDDKTREKIRTSQLVNRLMDHAVGNVDMTTTQIRAAEILLRKTVPDLSAVEHSGEVSTTETASAILRDFNAASDQLRAGVPDSGPTLAEDSGDVRH